MITEKAVQDKTIFIIEDDLSLAALLKMNMNKLFKKVEAYSNGDDAYKAVKVSPPDLLILDIMLDGMQGFEILEKIKSDSTLSDICVLILTGKNREKDVERAFELGADEYMSKPFKLNELRIRLNKLLR